MAVFWGVADVVTFFCAGWDAGWEVTTGAAVSALKFLSHYTHTSLSLVLFRISGTLHSSQHSSSIAQPCKSKVPIFYEVDINLIKLSKCLTK
jgi:hypothetical protein